MADEISINISTAEILKLFAVSDLVDKLHLTIVVYFSQLLIVIGIFGNFISIIIFLKIRDISGCSRIYYLLLSIADLGIVIIFGTPRWTGSGLFYLSNGTIFIWQEKSSTVICRLCRYVWHTLLFISISCLIGLTIENILAARFACKKI